MKNTQSLHNTRILGGLIAPLLACGAAIAGNEVVSPPSNPAPLPVPITEFGSYLGLSAVIADTTLRFPGIVPDEVTAGTAGFLLDGGYLFGEGFSLDGFFQYLEDDDDGKSYDGGGLIKYKQEFASGFAGFIGAGYEWREVEITDGFETKNQAILANIGVEYQIDRFLGRLSYTQGFTNSSTVDIDFLGVSADLDDEDTGTLELMTAYQFYPHLSVTAAGSVELLQEASITDDWTASLGLRYDF